MFYTLSPSKPINFKLRFKQKPSQKFKKIFGHKCSKCTKMGKEKRREKRNLTSGESSGRRGRERGRRGAEVREREGERESGLLKWMKSRRRRKEEMLAGSAGFVPKRRRFARSKRRRFVKSEIRILYTRTTGRSVTRNDTSFLTYSNDKSFDTHERHAVCLQRGTTVHTLWTTRRFTQCMNDWSFGSLFPRFCFSILNDFSFN